MDWKNTTYSAESNSVPDSCCLSDIEGCGQGVLATSENQVILTSMPTTTLKTLVQLS